MAHGRERAGAVRGTGWSGDRRGRWVRPAGFALALALACLVASFVLPAAAASLPAAAAPLPAPGQAELIAADPATQAHFGSAVAVSGDTALVGAPGCTVAGKKGAGAVYVFVRSGGSWAQVQKLSAPDAARGDTFGTSVALSADTCVVGAPGDGHARGAGPGAAYVFAHTAGTWALQAELRPAGAGREDRFGAAVAADGDAVLVGAPGHVVAGAQAGAAYVFVRVAGAWIRQRTLDEGTDFGDFDWFGASVALSGDTALIGAPGHVSGGRATGAAYVYTLAAGAWSLRQTLTTTEARASAAFGCSVALSGDTALVGASNAVSSGHTTGAAYVFALSAGVWAVAQRLTDGGTHNDQFGASVALAGDTAVVGAPLSNVGTDSWAGAACVFARAGGVWTQTRSLTARDRRPVNYFGCAVATDGATALAGSYTHRTAKKWGAGAAYAFALDGMP